MKSYPRKKVKRLGRDRPDFEIEEVTPVEIRKTIKGRIIDTAWQVVATGICLTIFHMYILPLF